MLIKVFSSFVIPLILAIALISPPLFGMAANLIQPSGISNLTTNLVDYANGKIPQYNKFELSFDLNSLYTNPYDPDEIQIDGVFTSPTAAMLVQPGFIYQNYELDRANGVEIYIAEGKPIWKIRFSPAEVGIYQYEIKLTDKTGMISAAKGQFQVVASNEKGFIRVSKKNQRYFEFDNGFPFWGIGLNIGWWQDESKRISFYQGFFEQMKENKLNFARVWMTNSGKDQNWILSIQDKELGSHYNQEEAWAFDQILNQAQEKDIYLLLTLDDVNQYTYNWKDNLYQRDLGGPCSYRSCIFINSDAKKFQRRLFRYIIARWGYSRAVFSWELFNEIDELQWSDLLHWNRQKMIQWHQEMIQYIRSIDAHHHLTNTSTGSFKTHPDLYQMPEMDFAQIHFYYVPGCCTLAPSDPEGKDIAGLTSYYAQLVYQSVTDKPSIIGEWGVLGENWSPSPMHGKINPGVHIHNALWASLMSGMAVSGLNWEWNDHQVNQNTWWRNYQSIANYFEGIPLEGLTVAKPLNGDFHLSITPDSRPAAFSTSNDRLRVLGLRKETAVYAWVQNKDNTWWNNMNGIAPDPQSGTLTIYHLAPGKNYTIEWWDTYRTSQQVIMVQVRTAQENGSIQLKIDHLTNDLALKIYPSVSSQMVKPI